MRFRKPTVEPLEINLTPMIDCLLFLIVFLLLSTTFNHFSKLNIILPQAEGVPITEGAMQDPTMLAAGVSQALITTAGGMLVAIPAVIAYRIFQRRIIDINAAFEQEAGLMMQELLDNGLITPR